MSIEDYLKIVKFIEFEKNAFQERINFLWSWLMKIAMELQSFRKKQKGRNPKVMNLCFKNKDLILKLKKENVSNYQIASFLNISETSIRKFLKLIKREDF